MRRILIPTDFSENAMNAIRYAVELFKYEQSVFYIIHTYADDVYNHLTLVSRDNFEEIKQSTKQNSDKELLTTQKIIYDISPNPRHEYKVQSIFGNLVDEANDIVDKENIDIIIMGTQGKQNDKQLTFGSNTLQVIKYVKCPVLAIPNECSYQAPKNILLPTDFILPYKRRELKLLCTLAKSFRSKINFLYVSDFAKLSIRQEDHKIFLKECLPDIALQFHRVANDTNLTRVINEFIRTQHIDFLVMINSRYSYLETVLYQSTIDKIGLHIKVPFLVMQNLQRY
ncbi:universal stress protein [Aquimarina sp. 2201CG1-2-11]|uniref:universal stress protein n=1 Tax=Aquimarina discodermiae TaxID=3231043 RepID=UPI003462A10B